MDSILDGVVHWLAAMDREDYYEFILSFDLAKEKFGQIKLPEWSYVDILKNSVMALRGRLSLVVHYLNWDVEGFDVWVMNEYGAQNSWTKQAIVGLMAVNFSSAPLGSTKNGEVIMCDDEEELFSYDPIVRRVKNLQIRGVSRSSVCTSYMESLVLLNQGH